MDEFAVIAEFFAPLATAPFAFGLKDDAAAIPPRAGFDLVVTTDQIAEGTGLSRKQVSSVIEKLTDVIESHVMKNAVGEFILPGLLKIGTVRKPAVKARKGINPFTKEATRFAAKPASTKLKVRPLKKLKDAAA